MTIIGALPFILQNDTTADATQVMADFNAIVTAVNINAAAAGANSSITSLTGLTTPLSVSQGGSGSATPAPFSFTGGYRNIARRNGGLEIWQRGAGGAASFALAASAGNPYTADGWYLANGANQACVVSQQAGITNGSQWCLKFIRNSGQTGTGVMFTSFPLDTDELYPMLGQFVRLSFTAKAGANWSPGGGNLFAVLTVGTGVPVKVTAGYTGSTTPISTSFPLTTSATRFQISSSVVVPITTRQAEIAFVWTPVGTAGADDSFYIDDVQLEIVPAATGYTASNFERLLFAEQLMLCQRHYWKSFIYSIAPAQAATNAGCLLWQAVGTGIVGTAYGFTFPVNMRVTPSTLTYSPVALNVQVYNSRSLSSLDVTLSTADTKRMFISAVGDPGMAPTDILQVQASADAGI